MRLGLGAGVTLARGRYGVVAGPLTAGIASATSGDTTVALTASSPTGGTAPYTYQWFRSTSSGTKGSAISGATSRPYTDTGRTNGTTYYYTLTVTDSAAASVDYPQVSATPETAEEPSSDPLAVTGLSATVNGDRTVTLTWTDAENATGYQVLRDDVLIDTVAQGVQTYTDDPLGVGGGGGDDPPPDPDAPNPPAAGSGSMVASGGPIFFDTRSGAVSNGLGSGADGGNLQTVANLTAADALFWDNWDAGSGSNSRTFTTNFNGSGTRAFRFQYRRYSTCVGNDEQDVGIRAYPVQTTKRAVYWQWKMWSGRHPNDAGTSHGTIGQFAHHNPECTSNNFGRKIAIFGRNQSSGTGAANRFDLLAPGSTGGPATTVYSLIMNGTDFGDGTVWNASVNPNDYVGQEVTVTVYLCAESAPSAGDGAVKLWINGVQQINAQNIRIGSANWQANDRGFEGPSVINGPRYDQVEYWWDIVGWEA
jgi:fibronectin type 3 domain-containing protein